MNKAKYKTKVHKLFERENVNSFKQLAELLSKAKEKSSYVKKIRRVSSK